MVLDVKKIRVKVMVIASFRLKSYLITTYFLLHTKISIFSSLKLCLYRLQSSKKDVTEERKDEEIRVEGREKGRGTIGENEET